MGIHGEVGCGEAQPCSTTGAELEKKPRVKFSVGSCVAMSKTEGPYQSKTIVSGGHIITPNATNHYTFMATYFHRRGVAPVSAELVFQPNENSPSQAYPLVLLSGDKARGTYGSTYFPIASQRSCGRYYFQFTFKGTCAITNTTTTITTTTTTTEVYPEKGLLGTAGIGKCRTEYYAQGPVDGQWSDWSACTLSCVSGSEQSIQTRSCTNPPPAFGGKQCHGANMKVCEVPSCAEPPAPAIDGSWGPWSQCSTSCGQGTQTRVCNHSAPSDGGHGCEGANVRECIQPPCPINGGWSAWSPCDAACGPDHQSRSCSNPAPAWRPEMCGGDLEKL